MTTDKTEAEVMTAVAGVLAMASRRLKWAKEAVEHYAKRAAEK